MEFNIGEILATLVPQLGFAAIFLWQFAQEKKENKENISQRDNRIKELTTELVDLSKKVVETVTTFKEEIARNTSAVERNTQSNQNLSEKINTIVSARKNEN